MKVWEMENTDVVRFVLSREEWSVLIKGLASATAWAPVQSEAWESLDVLRNAEVDVEASAMVKALHKITEYTQRNKRQWDANDITIIHAIASNALKKSAPDHQDAGGE